MLEWYADITSAGTYIITVTDYLLKLPTQRDLRCVE